MFFLAYLLTVFVASLLTFFLASLQKCVCHSFHVSWHSVWQSLWHIFWHPFWHLCWHSFWQSFGEIFWHSFSLLLTVFLAYVLTFFLASSDSHSDIRCISPDILPDILSGISFDILSDIFAAILSDFLAHISSDIFCITVDSGHSVCHSFSLLLTFFLASLRTFCLTFFAYLLTFCLTLFLAKSSDSLSDILSGASSGILWGMSPHSLSNFRNYGAKHGPRRSQAESTTIAFYAKWECKTKLRDPFFNPLDRIRFFLFLIFLFHLLCFGPREKVNKAPSILFSFLFCRWSLEKIDRLYIDILDISLMNSWASYSTRRSLKDKAYIYIFFCLYSNIFVSL